MWTATRRHLVGTIAAIAAGALLLAGCSAGSSTTDSSGDAPSSGEQNPSSAGDGTTGGGPDSSAVGSSDTGADDAGGGTGPAGETAPSSSPADPSLSDATLNVGFVAPPASLDFTQDDGAAIPQALLYNVYEGLVKLDESGKIVPLLAESWDVSGDNTVYTFTLQQGVTFSDGSDFTAEDAVFSIERVKEEWKPAIKAKMDVVAEAEAVDPTTLKVTLSHPSQSWLYDMTTRIGAMFSSTGVDKLATEAIGTGPFTVASYNPNVEMVLQRNPDYWGTPAQLKTVTLKYFKDANSMNNAEIGGSIDVISSVQAPETLDMFSDTSQYQTIEGTTTGEVLLSFNNSQSPLNDVTVRRAISYALDRQAILDTVWAGKGTLIGSHAVPTDPWYTDLSDTYPYDPEKAKQLLDGKTYTLRLRVPNLPYATGAAPIIASQLQQVGITVKVDTLDFPADWLQQVFTDGNYDMSIVNHVEPRDLATIWGNSDYYPHYDNPKVRQLLESGDAGDEQTMINDYRKVTEILAEDAAGVWLWAFPNLVVATADVHGLAENQITESFDLTAVSRG